MSSSKRSMILQSLEDAVMEIRAGYNSKPNAGWQVSVHRNPRGFYDAFFANPGELWQIKVDTIYGKPTGLGAKLEGIDTSKLLSHDMPSFGLRELTPDEKLLELLNRTGARHENLLGLLSSKPPVSQDAIRSPAVLEGPILGGIDTGFISEEQKKLDQSLDLELRRFMRRSQRLYL